MTFFRTIVLGCLVHVLFWGILIIAAFVILLKSCGDIWKDQDHLPPELNTSTTLPLRNPYIPGSTVPATVPVGEAEWGYIGTPSGTIKGDYAPYITSKTNCLPGPIANMTALEALGFDDNGKFPYDSTGVPQPPNRKSKLMPTYYVMVPERDMAEYPCGKWVKLQYAFVSKTAYAIVVGHIKPADSDARKHSVTLRLSTSIVKFIGLNTNPNDAHWQRSQFTLEPVNDSADVPGGPWLNDH